MITHLLIESLESRIAPAAVATIDLTKLDGSTGFKILGQEASDASTNTVFGQSVSAIGDINGDGYGDFIVGEKFGDGINAATQAGASYVVLGKKGGFSKTLKVSDLTGKNGFKITTASLHANSGWSVSAAGDVNGDGIDDLIISAIRFGNEGAAFVVYGSRDGFDKVIDLGALDGTNGFKIAGAVSGDETGYSVSSAGDINGDGFVDLLVGAPEADPNGVASGATYVVLGKDGGFNATVNLADLNGANGFKIQGEAAGDFSGAAVSGAGDVNGDHFDDIVIGAPGVTVSSQTGVGAAYVVFGRANDVTPFAATLNLSSLSGSNGFKMSVPTATAEEGGTHGLLIGAAVSGAGDLNGDGFADVVIGAPRDRAFSTPRVGSYVIFGHAGSFSSPIDLDAVSGSIGFHLIGPDASEQGISVSRAGDVNGDGFDDIIVGADNAGVLINQMGRFPGAAYVVFGKMSGFSSPLDLTNLGSGGFRLLGDTNLDNAGAGAAVSSAGDVNGDGFDDILVGEIYANPNKDGSGATGGAYVVFGSGTVGSGMVFSKDHKSASYTEPDGDGATVKISKGSLSVSNFVFASNGSLATLDLTAKGPVALGSKPTVLAGSSVTLTAKTPKGGAGDGLANVDFIDAHGLDLGAVSVSGRLEKITAGDGALDAHMKPIAALKSLTVGTLGPLAATPGSAVDYHSVILGPLGSLAVKHDLFNAFVETTGITGSIGKVSIGGNLDGSGGGTNAGLLKSSGDIGAVTIGGSAIGGADFSGIAAGGKLGKVSIGGFLESLDPAKPVMISALGHLGATKAADAVAIASLTVKHNVFHALILAGYSTTLTPLNPDAGIGAISVAGNWDGSSVAAGVADSTGDGFGRNDTLIAEPVPNTIFATIASITIKGLAMGTGNSNTDFFGLTAQKIGKVSIPGVPVPLAGADVAVTADFHLVTL